jgi:tetratricopeptide (TPR) repeat protein
MRAAALLVMASALLEASSGAALKYQEANLLFEQQKFAAAGEALDSALREDPGYVPAWTLRGKLAMAFNQFDIARAAFMKAASLDRASAYTQFMLGFFYYFDNDFSRAVAPLEAAARLNTEDPRPVFYLALTEEGLARPDLALPLYQKTIALETEAGKSNPETHTAYGRLLFTLGRFDESAVQVARVLELDPNSRDGHYERGRLAFEKDRFAEAAAEAERAMQEPGSGTTDRQIHFLLARAYAKAGNKDLAALHRKQFEASPPTLRR